METAGGVKTKAHNQPCADDSNEAALRRLVKAPETALEIYDFAESLYLRDGREATGRMSLADIERVHAYLRQTENDIEKMNKQFLDLAEIEGGFQTDEIPVGF